MKNNFLIEVSFSMQDHEDFIVREAEQRMVINRLMDKNIVMAYALSTDNKHGWIVLSAENKSSAYRMLQKLPLFDFMQTRVFELGLLESPMFVMPQLLMN
ncbi:MAG: hypothetical protein LC101_07285 [Flavobacteriales bacterium]|nr:hypothetical protein [Flavobacteriales bacterium]